MDTSCSRSRPKSRVTSRASYASTYFWLSKMLRYTCEAPNRNTSLDTVMTTGAPRVRRCRNMPTPLAR
eukprot:291777-Pyramimonas_sp.AAC.1